ncbi:hypothetical protein BFR04_03125 [Gaetbulibacter sp. 4G1]|nr:energy transducer TonB [Gaetbulibacter sp. 4G1]PIA78541.1 hypothetical protein BFR04_03125 [Gaetbulibacter sp. 4G1]
MIHYILQTIAFQLFFLLAYDVFLKRDTFFNWNRMYLLVTSILSLILPFIKINSLKEVLPQNYIVSLPEVVLGQTNTNINDTIALDTVVLENNSFPYWELIFYIGVFIAFSLFLFKVIKIFVLVLKNPKQSIGNIVLVELINSNAAFSFFSYIFLGEHIKEEDKESILKHELIHAQQKHTLDLLFFEVLRIVFWFNPLVYMYQNRMATLHEFIADANAVKHQNKSEYYQNLLEQVFETKKISFINTFFKQSLIKKRIVMLSKTKSKQIHLFKYALLIPMVLGMLVYTSAEAQDKPNISSEIELNKFSYSLGKDEELVGEKKEIHEKYESFLKNNKDYVSWGYIDKKNDIVKYSVHSVKEKVPNGFSKSEVSFPDGSSYIIYYNISYFDWGNTETPKELSEKEKKERKEELLKLKEEYKSALEVPFAVIDQVPIFPGCENITKEEQKKCISNNIAKHVNQNFNIDLANKLSLTGKQRINVIFKINKEGNVTGIRSRAPHPDLEAEAIRVINTLPKMIPGKHKGKNVVVPYSLPIIFQIADKIEEKASDVIPLDEVEVPFAVIENVPVYPGCEDLASNIEKKKCMSDNISEFVAKNFNTKIANQNELSGRQRINVIFKIDKEGNITGVRSRAPHPALEAEAIRVISSLPKMKPGIQRGKPVTVPYSLPIIFEVEEKTKMLDEVTITDDLSTSNVVPFAVVEEPPIFPGCENLSKADQKECVANEVALHVNKNFNTKLATELGLAGRQRINVIFKIDKEGNIIDIRSRAPHPDLESEAKRVVKSLPKFKPGSHNGKIVTVPYSLPIIFQVSE